MIRSITSGVTVSILCTFLFVSTGVAQQATIDTEQLSELIRAHVRTRYYSETEATLKIKKWGPDTAHVLIELLQESTDPYTVDKIVFYLGKTKSPGATTHIIEHIEATETQGRRSRWGYRALGWLESAEAIAFLVAGLEDPETRPLVHPGLAKLNSSNAFNILQDIYAESDEATKAQLETVIERLERDLKESEIVRVGSLTVPAVFENRAAFWKHQERPENPLLQAEIVGEYEGTVYWRDYLQTHRVEDIVLNFKLNGVVETNLKNLTTNQRPDLRYSDSHPAAHLSDTHSSQYRVLSPTQLVIAPGNGITTFAPSLSGDILTFYHKWLGMFFSLRRTSADSAASQIFEIKDVVGLYSGTLSHLNTKDPRRINTYPEIQIIFAENGKFVPNLGRLNGVFRGHDIYRGEFVIDSFGKLVIGLGFGGGDYLGSTILSFFDWFYQDSQIHATHHDGHRTYHLMLSPGGKTVEPDTTVMLENLTHGTFRGTAYRAELSGEIEEIQGVTIHFDQAGIYHSNFSKLLRRKEDQYSPEDSGTFSLRSPRHLLMSDDWGDGEFTSKTVTDFMLDGDSLYLTSFGRDAYLVLQRQSDD